MGHSNGFMAIFSWEKLGPLPEYCESQKKQGPEQIQPPSITKDCSTSGWKGQMSTYFFLLKYHQSLNLLNKYQAPLS